MNVKALKNLDQRSLNITARDSESMQKIICRDAMMEYKRQAGGRKMCDRIDLSKVDNLFVDMHNASMKNLPNTYNSFQVDLEDMGFHWHEEADTTLYLHEIVDEYEKGNFLLDDNECPFNFEDFLDRIESEGLIEDEKSWQTLRKIARGL
jgi:hypothetical protein